MSYHEIARQLLAEVEMTWCNVVLEPMRGPRDFSGEACRHSIVLRAPPTSLMMLWVLAHECGHVHHEHWRWISKKEYLAEEEAEKYGWAAGTSSACRISSISSSTPRSTSATTALSATASWATACTIFAIGTGRRLNGVGSNPHGGN